MELTPCSSIWLKIFQVLSVSLYRLCLTAFQYLDGELSLSPCRSSAVDLGRLADNTFTGKYLFPNIYLIELVGTEYTMHKDACAHNGIALPYFICPE